MFIFLFNSLSNRSEIVLSLSQHISAQEDVEIFRTLLDSAIDLTSEVITKCLQTIDWNLDFMTRRGNYQDMQSWLTGQYTTTSVASPTSPNTEETTSPMTESTEGTTKASSSMITPRIVISILTAIILIHE